ncbi:MAG: YncE family protein [Muribaculaceae bacterium]|nr:YncE family protein [Muribaculaceae bacterium]
MKKFSILLASAAMLFGAVSCSEEDGPAKPSIDGITDYDNVTNAGNGGGVAGFYVLNEGNMGFNKATIDFFDYEKGRYARNLFPEANPDEVLALGDMGNDIAVYGDRLFIVVNGSNKVEVLEAGTARRIGQLDVSSPRYIAFDGDCCYVTSYVGGEAGKGSVQRFDIKTLKNTGSVSVGISPEEMAMVAGKLYVANSADFNTGTFDNTISVVDLASFKAETPIEVEVNMHHLRAAADGTLWVNSRGNYADKSSAVFMLENKDGKGYEVAKAFNINCDNFTIGNGKVYFYGTTYDENWNATYNYGMIDAATAELLPGSFITDGTEKSIATPYCIAVQPGTGDIFITDAKDYVSSGAVICYSKDGRKQWSVKAGDIPGHIAFLK